jgi:hypothetical protein
LVLGGLIQRGDGIMNRRTWITNERYWCANCREVVQRCRDLLEGRLGVIEAATLLRELSNRVSAEEDPDFMLFRFLDGEAPLAGPPGNWPACFEREDVTIAGRLQACC